MFSPQGHSMRVADGTHAGSREKMRRFPAVRKRGPPKWPAWLEAACGRLAQRLRHQADPEHRLLDLVEEFHVPVGVLFQVASNAAKQVGADPGHLDPGSLAAFKFRGLVGRAGIATVADSKKIQRHR